MPGVKSVLNVDLSIVIVSWNVADYLRQCLISLQDSKLRLISSQGDLVSNDDTEFPVVEVIVVDSSSNDDSVAMIQRDFEWIHLIVSEQNIGFVRGNNLGLAAARGQNIMLLNPDTRVFPDTLPRLLEVLIQDQTIGIVGPQTFNTDGTHQSSRRRFPTFATAVFESTWLEGLAPSNMMKYFRVEDMPHNGTYDVDWMQGSALMARREVYDDIGGLDERYIMYAEEMDWCRRASEAGWRCVYVGDAHLIHHGGQSTTQVKARSHVHFQHSKLRYFRKFHGWLPAFLLRIILMLNYLAQIVIEGSKWLIGHKRPLRAERVSAYWIVVQSLLWAGETIVVKQE